MEKWHIYVGEARTQIEFAKRCYAAYLGAVASNNVGETFFQLHHFIVHAVNVDKLLDAKPGSERRFCQVISISREWISSHFEG